MIPLERNPDYDRVVNAVAEFLDVSPGAVLVMSRDGMLLRALRLMRPADVERLAAGAGSGEATAA